MLHHLNPPENKKKAWRLYWLNAKDNGQEIIFHLNYTVKNFLGQEPKSKKEEKKTLASAPLFLFQVILAFSMPAGPARRFESPAAGGKTA